MEAPDHQFDDILQQEDAVRLGMWIFLATEVLFFGGMFLTYAVYRSAYPEAFAEASRHLSVFLGTLNTAILLCSSLTVALSVHEADRNNRRLSLLLVSTLVLGCLFLIIKFYEYYEKYEEHLIPGANFVWHGTEATHASIFFLFYFIMTGLHALHMIIGIGVVGLLAFRSRRRAEAATYIAPIDAGGLYWHFVDAIWVFLFPLLYLVDRSQ